MNKRDEQSLERIVRRVRGTADVAEQMRLITSVLFATSGVETPEEPEEEKTFEYSAGMRNVLDQQKDEHRAARILAAKEQRLLKREQRKLEREADQAAAHARQLQRKKESLRREEEKRKREKEIEEETTRKCKTLGDSEECHIHRTSLHIYVDGECSKCGAEGYLLPFKGQILCRDCLCEDDPDAEKRQFISSNFSQSVTISSGASGGRFHGVNATWVLDRYVWADAVIRSLPYKFTNKQFLDMRNELVEWSNFHPRTEWRNARSMLLARFAGELAMYDMVPNKHGKVPGFTLKHPTDIRG